MPVRSISTAQKAMTSQERAKAKAEAQDQKERIKKIALCVMVAIVSTLTVCNRLFCINLTPYLIGAAASMIILKILEQGTDFTPKVSLSIPFGFMSVRVLG